MHTLGSNIKVVYAKIQIMETNHQIEEIVRLISLGMLKRFWKENFMILINHLIEQGRWIIFKKTHITIVPWDNIINKIQQCVVKNLNIHQIMDKIISKKSFPLKSTSHLKNHLFRRLDSNTNSIPKFFHIPNVWDKILVRNLLTENLIFN